MSRTAYEIAADDLVAVMYHDKAAYQDIRFRHNLRPKLMPQGHYQAFTEAVFWLYEHDKSVHDTTIIERAPGIPLQWLAERITLYDDTRTSSAVIRDNCEIVTKWGLHDGTRRLLQIADQQLAESGVEKRLEIVGNLSSLLSTIGTDKQAQAVSAHEHGKLNRLKDAQSTDGFPTGLTPIDSLANGYEAGHIWWIGGAYKGRKTTLLLNMMLSIAMTNLIKGTSNLRPAFLSREMLQSRVQRQIESMLAVAHIWKSGYYGQTGKTANGYDYQHDWITHNTIKTMNRLYGTLEGEAQRERYINALGEPRGNAIYWAQRIYDQLRLRIYDSTPEHGNLSDYYSIETVMNMDIVNHGGNWFGVDYLQLIDAPGDNLFSQVNFMAKKFQSHAQRKKITTIVLAQLNEESIKGGESYSPGVKGGGDPAQTADYFIKTRYNQGVEATPDKLDVQMKLSRHGASGRDEVSIHPSSGLILDQQWLGELKL